MIHLSLNHGKRYKVSSATSASRRSEATGREEKKAFNALSLAEPQRKAENI